MDLSSFIAVLRGAPSYRSLLRRWRRDGSLAQPLRLPRSARGLLAAALAGDLQAPVLVVAARPDRLLTLEEELTAWSPGLPVRIFASPTPLFYEKEPWGARTIHQRIAVLSDLAVAGRPALGAAVVLVATKGLITRTLSPQQLRGLTTRLRRGEVVRYDALLSSLVSSGYRPESLVVEPGQFSRRGGILDVWPPGEPFPARLEFFGDEIESLRRFDPEQQRSLDDLETFALTPAREAAPGLLPGSWRRYLPPEPDQAEARLEFFLAGLADEPSTLLDYLPGNAIVLLDDGAAIEEAVTEQEEQALEQQRLLRQSGGAPAGLERPYLTLDELRESLLGRGAIDLGFLTGPDQPGWPLEDAFQPGPRFAGQLNRLTEHLLAGQVEHEPVIVVSRQADRLAEVWSSEAGETPVADVVPSEIEPGAIVFLRGSLSDGWTLDAGSGRV
ncbi:MAG TPA: hypothetical protein VK449_03205, partial [Anaerolineales bacterium]|nr:hypothetical protein [Anaerolineales bacterium]